MNTSVKAPRRFTASVSVAIASALMLAATGCSSPQASSPATGSADAQSSPQSSETVTLRIGFTAADGGTLPISPIGWAEYKGYLDDELKEIGITDVEFYGFDSGPGVNEAVAAGELDLSMNGDTPAIVGRTNGLKTRLININQLGINVYLIAKTGGPQTLEELRGKTVGVRVGAIPHRYLVGTLQEAGLTGDVKIVNLTNSEGEAALTRGDIDAYAATSALAYRLKSQNFKVIDEAANHADLTGSNITSATETFLAAHPEFVHKWYEVLQRATEEIKAQPQAYYQFVSEINKQPTDVSEFTSPVTLFPSEPLPAAGVDRLQKTQQFLLSEKIVKTEFPFDAWVYRNP